MKAGCFPLFFQQFIGSVGLKQFQAIWRLAGLPLGFQAATLDAELAAVQKTKKQRSRPVHSGTTASWLQTQDNLCSKNKESTL